MLHESAFERDGKSGRMPAETVASVSHFTEIVGLAHEVRAASAVIHDHCHRQAPGEAVAPRAPTIEASLPAGRADV